MQHAINSAGRCQGQREIQVFPVQCFIPRNNSAALKQGAGTPPRGGVYLYVRFLVLEEHSLILRYRHVFQNHKQSQAPKAVLIGSALSYRAAPHVK